MQATLRLYEQREHCRLHRRIRPRLASMGISRRVGLSRPSHVGRPIATHGCTLNHREPVHFVERAATVAVTTTVAVAAAISARRSATSVTAAIFE